MQLGIYYPPSNVHLRDKAFQKFWANKTFTWGVDMVRRSSSKLFDERVVVSVGLETLSWGEEEEPALEGNNKGWECCFTRKDGCGTVSKLLSGAATGPGDKPKSELYFSGLKSSRSPSLSFLILGCRMRSRPRFEATDGLSTETERRVPESKQKISLKNRYTKRPYLCIARGDLSAKKLKIDTVFEGVL